MSPCDWPLAGSAQSISDGSSGGGCGGGGGGGGSGGGDDGVGPAVGLLHQALMSFCVPSITVCVGSLQHRPQLYRRKLRYRKGGSSCKRCISFAPSNFVTGCFQARVKLGSSVPRPTQLFIGLCGKASPETEYVPAVLHAEPTGQVSACDSPAEGSEHFISDGSSGGGLIGGGGDGDGYGGGEMGVGPETGM